MTYIDVNARIAPWVDDYAPDADARMHEAELEAEARDDDYDAMIERAEAAVECARETGTVCPSCAGDGRIPDKSGGGHHGVCPECGGTGVER